MLRSRPPWVARLFQRRPTWVAPMCSEPTDESGDGDVAAADQDTYESAAPAVSFGSDAQRADGLQRRLDALEAEVERLRTLDAEVARLRADLNDLRAQLGG